MMKLSGTQKKLLKTGKKTELISEFMRTKSLYEVVEELVNCLETLNAKEEKVDKINVTSKQIEMHFNVKG